MLDRDSKYEDCLRRARDASSTGSLEEALVCLDEALRHNPAGAEARNGRGEILWDQGRCDESLSEFGQVVEAAPEFIPGHLNRIEILIEEFGEHEEALDIADGVLAGQLERVEEAEVYYLKAKALFYMEDLEGALFLVRRACQVNPEVAVYHGFEGQLLFELGRFALAKRSLVQSGALDPDAPHTLYYLAVVEEALRNYETAEDFFARAAEIQPESYPQPVRIDADDFERAANSALDDLPTEIATYVANCPILIEDLPSETLVRSENVSPQILGLFLGTPATEPGASPTMGTATRSHTDRILLFKRNLEKVAASRDDLIEQIQITVKHEIGHYLGLDEDEIERLGLA
jgi:predicted Zn-dependent protease with MMP-like domain